MYPSGDLKRLAVRREALQARIARRRARCAELGRYIESGVDRWARWGRLIRAGFLGAAGLGLFRRRRSGAAGRSAANRTGSVLRWAPLAWRAARLVLRR